MGKTIIYITGSPGFKSAIMNNLGPTWTYGTQDISQQLVSFELPKNMTTKRFKYLIGESTLSEHDIMFLYGMRYNSLPTIQTFISPVRRFIFSLAEMRFRTTKEIAPTA
jgi:hypothetical protein